MPARHLFAILIAFLSCVGLESGMGQVQAPETAVVSASVAGSIASGNLSPVTVILESTASNPLANFDGYSTIVAEDGSFHFSDVAPGEYRLIATAKDGLYGEYGYRPHSAPGKTLQIKSADCIRDLSIELFPDPKAICGRIVNENGSPVEANVEVYSLYNSWAQLEQPVKRTDSEGYFIFPVDDRDDGDHFVRADGVWYPSTTEFAKAVPLKPGTQSDNGCRANIQLMRQNCDQRVAATIQGELKDRAAEYKASLFAVHPSGALFLTDVHPLYRRDRVDFEGVCDGSYLMTVQPANYSNGQYFVSSTIQASTTITAAPLKEVTEEEFSKLAKPRSADIKIPANSETASVSATLRLDGLKWDQVCAVGVSRQPELLREGDYNGKFSLVDEKGSFSFRSLKPGIYRLTFGEAARGSAYIKSFTVDGRSASPEHFSITSGQAARVEAVLSNDPHDAQGRLRVDFTAKQHYLPNGTHPAASISGTVTGEEAGSATVTLHALRFNSAQSDSYETVASATGAFHFDAVDPGIYELFTKGKNRPLSAYGAKGPGREGMPIVLSAGQHLDGIALPVFPKVSVCGRLLDADGRPQPGVDVWAEWFDETYTKGNPDYLQNHMRSDDQGRYEITGLGSNDLRLWAQEGKRKTYFPSTTDYSQALTVNSDANTSACIHDIYLPSPGKDRAERGASVSGIIEGDLNKTLGDRFFVNLSSGESEYVPNVAPVEIKAAGPFSIYQVWPGNYTLTITGEYGNGSVPCGMPSSICFGHYRHLLASRQITVTKAGLEGLKIEIGVLPALDGEVLIDGKEPDAENKVEDPTLAEEYASEGERTAKLDAHGHFSFAWLDVRPYEYRLTTYEPKYYLQSMLLDGKPVDGRHIQLQFGQKSHLVVRLATDGASGTVTPSPVQPPTDPYRDLCRYFGGQSTLVLMIPDPLPEDNSGILESASTTDDDAEFSQVPPGRYRVVAMDDAILPGRGFVMPRGSVYLSKRDDLVKLSTLGLPVQVEARQSFHWSVPVATEQMRRILAEEGTPSTF